MKVLSKDKTMILEFVNAEICRFPNGCKIKVNGKDVAGYKNFEEAEVAFGELINRYIANEKLHKIK